MEINRKARDWTRESRADQPRLCSFVFVIFVIIDWKMMTFDRGGMCERNSFENRCTHSHVSFVAVKRLSQSKTRSSTTTKKRGNKFNNHKLMECLCHVISQSHRRYCWLLFVFSFFFPFVFSVSALHGMRERRCVRRTIHLCVCIDFTVALYR